MKNCGHISKSECAWENASYFNIQYENVSKNDKECYGCGVKMVKGAHQGLQPNSKFCWNIQHIDSNPWNNSCENLIAMHPVCNNQQGWK